MSLITGALRKNTFGNVHAVPRYQQPHSNLSLPLPLPPLSIPYNISPTAFLFVLILSLAPSSTYRFASTPRTPSLRSVLHHPRALRLAHSSSNKHQQYPSTPACA